MMVMKMKKTFAILAALGALAWAGCQREVEAPSQDEKPLEEITPADSLWTVTINAVTEPEVATKGLAIGDGDTQAATSTLKSIWKDWQKVQVYLGSTLLGELSVTPDASDAHYATLSGEVKSTSITAGSTHLTLLATERDEWDYTGQVGKLLLTDDASESIEKKYHYTMAENVLVTGLTSGSGTGKGVLTTEDAVFANQQSIYRFSFRFQKSGSDDKTPITAKRVLISSAGGHLVQSKDMVGSTVTEGPISVILGTATADPFFVALRNGNTTDAEALSFEVVGNDGITYTGSKTIPAEYKPNGTFVSVKNATLTGRKGLSESTSTVTEAL